MKTDSKLRLLTVLLLLALLPTLASAHKPYDRIVVFGDSLSDPGNAYFLLGRVLAPPYDTLDALLVPDAPYAFGGHHFSNGPTWVEQLASTLDLNASAGPAFANGRNTHRRKLNYAIGGARARDTGSGADMTEQINVYLSQGTGRHLHRTLYVIEFGNNDVRDAIAAMTLDPGGATSTGILSDALNAISDNLLSLYTAGAREFLIGNAADLSLTPAIRILDVIAPGAAMASAIISAQFNAGLDELINQFETRLPGISLTKFDIHGGLQAMVADPAKYHLRNVTDACIKPNIAPYRCRSAKRYLFWDGIHPTKTGHGIFADIAYEELFPERVSGTHRSHPHRCVHSQEAGLFCHH